LINWEISMVSYNVLVVGDRRVGKTALAIQFSQYRFTSDYEPAEPRKESSCSKLSNIDDEQTLLNISFDTSAQEEYGEMGDQYIRTGQGFLIVYSITSNTSFEYVNLFREQILKVKDVDSFPIIIVGNKCDLEQEREVSTSKGREYAELYGFRFYETSAKLGENVEEIFFQLVREIKKWIVPERNRETPKRKGSGCIVF